MAQPRCHGSRIQPTQEGPIRADRPFGVAEEVGETREILHHQHCISANLFRVKLALRSKPQIVLKKYFARIGHDTGARYPVVAYAVSRCGLVGAVGAEERGCRDYCLAILGRFKFETAKPYSFDAGYLERVGRQARRWELQSFFDNSNPCREHLDAGDLCRRDRRSARLRSTSFSGRHCQVVGRHGCGLASVARVIFVERAIGLFTLEDNVQLLMSTAESGKTEIGGSGNHPIPAFAREQIELLVAWHLAQQPKAERAVGNPRQQCARRLAHLGGQSFEKRLLIGHRIDERIPPRNVARLFERGMLP